MEKDFKVNVFFNENEDGEELEEIIATFLINTLNIR